MEKYYDEILPCLESVGAWWTEPDRRLLFCYLLMIFPINAEYLAGLPAARYNDGIEQSVMNEHSIKNALQTFKKVNQAKKCTCAGIRGLDFSFGKLNPRTCYLCPYSGTYKNMRRADERRFLYHIMEDESRCLSNYLDLEDKKLENVFLSYFPVYVNNILVEAFPFLLFAEWFLAKEAGYYKRNLKEARKELLGEVRKSIEQRIPYLRIKELVEKETLDYKECIKKAADVELDVLEKENASTRPINEIMMIRLFRILANNKKYIHKKPEDYVTHDKALIVPNLFASPLLMEKKEESGEKNEASRKPETNKPIVFMEQAENLIIESEMRSQPGAFKEHENIKKAFQETYHIEKGDIEPFFIYGEHDRKTENVFLKAFLGDSRWFSVEPAEYVGMPGLLILNDEEDYIFYSLDRYSAKPVRAMADRGVPIYTSNIYNTGRYLCRAKVQKLALHDVGMAVSLGKGIQAVAVEEFTTVPFPECMKEYKDIYGEHSMNFGKEQQVSLERMEAYVPLLCADGEKPPFVAMNSLYNVKSSLEYEYLYKSGMHPIRDGVFLYLRAFSDKMEIQGEVLKNLYMDTCIELGRKVPFCEGYVQILELSNSGLLFYVMGNKMSIQKTQLYLSSCARRAFAKVSVKEHPVTFEQMTQEYFATKKE